MRKIIITSALPYANGSLHLGHILEAIQADIWARFQNLRQNQCLYFCADDAHGTPIMLKASANQQSPEDFIKPIQQEHEQDFANFQINFANYHTTHSTENKELATTIFMQLHQNGDIATKSIAQAYDKQAKMFLPDRYVTGTCPKCHAPEQHGDNCEKCGATYNPLEMLACKSIISGTTPVSKQSEHLFFKLSNYAKAIRAWLDNSNMQTKVKNKLLEWFEHGLNDWNISRDQPYFGFNIPNYPDKYFYVWLDAPIGYLASMLNYAKKNPEFDFNSIWRTESDYELYHFIGKDIIYFHAIFWPAILHGSNYRLPSSVFTHGFVTINGHKMSKSKGNFITAKNYLSLLDPEHLRYYFAAKLTNQAEDIDFNYHDYMNKINSDLIGKFINIGSRCSMFINKYFNHQLADNIHDQTLLTKIQQANTTIANYYENREYAKAIRVISECADLANQYIDQQQPWSLIKTSQSQQVQAICTMGLNLFRILTIYLKPVLPTITQKIEQFFNVASMTWDDIMQPLLSHQINEFTPLSSRVEQNNLTKLQETIMETPKAQPTINNEITIDDFNKIELCVAKIVTAEQVAGADALLKLQLDIGKPELVQVFAGIKRAYAPSEIIGRLTIFVANLKPRKMRFGVSNGMVLMAGDQNGLYMLTPDTGATPGMRIK